VICESGLGNVRRVRTKLVIAFFAGRRNRSQWAHTTLDAFLLRNKRWRTRASAEPNGKLKSSLKASMARELRANQLTFRIRSFGGFFENNLLIESESVRKTSHTAVDSSIPIANGTSLSNGCNPNQRVFKLILSNSKICLNHWRKP